MVKTTIKLGGSASNVTVAKVGHGLMMMTWKPIHAPDEQCFEAIKASLDSAPPGAKMLLNSGEFYGEVSHMNANLELLARFFEKNPSYANKAFLAVKGGTKADSHATDCSPENLRRSVNNINAKLRGTKTLDIFQPARIDPNFTVEDQMKTLATLQKEGKFGHIGLSECSAASVRRANAVVPITFVEIEVSPMSYGKEAKEVIATCAELGITVGAYSPMGRGFLTGKITKAEDFDEGDHRRHFTRFKKENIEHNFAIVDGLKRIADSKGITTGQLSIAWVSARGPHVLPLPGSSHKDRTLENLQGADVALTSAELKEIDTILETHPVAGGRYIDGMETRFNLWG
ncbi:Aldo-keto reductase 6 [Heterobasidion irregulare TC 32-1]|uniref:Aldo-keto reductase 6 n=1 Tax=Heterobasidion irregulare (strain TC 32-1) TaxID=747525 RepID=W4K1H2_HETIT|nr:Aldo-keto reductase 6 [Heterobasidion irregulare TC 32-1]ETW79569.1 Aldo-keto reductase 6 [Heterobasidion irregulare TC 32-1]